MRRLTLNLSASTIAGAAYDWTGPNGFTSTDQNPSITNVTAAAAGTYSVSATVGGCASAPAAITVTANPPAGISAQALNGSLILRWPVGGNWVLQYQSNPLAMGLGTNWIYVPGPLTNPFSVPIFPDAGSVFYRLVLSN